MQTEARAELDDLAAQFEVHRPKLQAIANRTLGSPWSADDAVQEAWLRLQRADAASINNLEAWLTTVISRVCIDLIRQQVGRREDLDDQPGDSEAAPAADSSGSDPVRADPSETVLRSDDLALAMQVVLETLGPLERLAFVLHDIFALSFDDIAPIVERTPGAARQLASRARARLRRVNVGQVRQRRDAAIGAFLGAAQRGDFGDLLQLLDPEIEVRSDDAAVELAAEGAAHGAPLLDRHVRGVDAVARVFVGRAQLSRVVLVDGVPAAAYVTGGTVHAVYLMTFTGDRITRVDVLAEPARLARLDMQLR